MGKEARPPWLAAVGEQSGRKAVIKARLEGAFAAGRPLRDPEFVEREDHLRKTLKRSWTAPETFAARAGFCEAAERLVDVEEALCAGPPVVRALLEARGDRPQAVADLGAIASTAFAEVDVSRRAIDPIESELASIIRRRADWRNAPWQ